MVIVKDATSLGQLKADFESKYMEVAAEVKSDIDAEAKKKREEALEKAKKAAMKEEKMKGNKAKPVVDNEDYEFLKKVGSTFGQA